MAQQKEKGLGAYIAWALKGTLGGFCVGVAIAVVGEQMERPSWNIALLYATILGPLVGLALIHWRARRIKAANLTDAASQLRQQEQYRAQQARQQQEDLERRRALLAQSLVQQAEIAVESFAAMPKYLNAAKGWTERAVASHRDGAFSPFWSAMENAYREIGGYQASMARIEQCSREHARLLGMLSAEGGVVPEIAAFPVDLDATHVQATLDEATDNLSDLAYQAQREPTFALIWEQRRTTAAVIAGFTSLESAVDGMRAAVSWSLQSLQQALHEGASQTERTLSGLSQSLANALVDSRRDEISALRHLSHRSDQIRDELHHQNWGRYPLLG